GREPSTRTGTCSAHGCWTCGMLAQAPSAMMGVTADTEAALVVEAAASLRVKARSVATRTSRGGTAGPATTHLSPAFPVEPSVAAAETAAPAARRGGRPLAATIVVPAAPRVLRLARTPYRGFRITSIRPVPSSRASLQRRAARP